MCRMVKAERLWRLRRVSLTSRSRFDFLGEQRVKKNYRILWNKYGIQSGRRRKAKSQI